MEDMEMGVVSKPFRVSFEDQLEANLAMIASVIRAYNKRMVIAMLLSLVIIGLSSMLLLEGTPAIEKAGSAGVGIGIVFILSAVISVLRRPHRAQMIATLRERAIERARNTDMTIGFADGWMESRREDLVSKMKLDGFFRLELSSGSTALFHPGYRTLCVVPVQFFEGEAAQREVERTLESVPVFPV